MKFDDLKQAAVAQGWDVRERPDLGVGVWVFTPESLEGESIFKGSPNNQRDVDNLITSMRRFGFKKSRKPK
jgi:hypothetical protein